MRHHPDKRRGAGEEIRDDDDYFTCITKAFEQLGTPLKRRVERAEERSQSTEKDFRGVLVPSQCREVFQPIVVEECAVVVGGYLKQPVAVTCHRHCDRLFVMLEHCDWVCNACFRQGPRPNTVQ